MTEPAPTVVRVPAGRRTFTTPDFHQLAQMPPATEWFANINDPNTRRAYRDDLKEFMPFVGISAPAEPRLVDSHARTRSAQGPRAPQTHWQRHPPQARRPVVPVRVPFGRERGDAQSGERRPPAQSGELRRQDPAAR